MRVRKVLLIYKKSARRIYPLRRGDRISLSRRGNEFIQRDLKRIQAAHLVHQRTLEKVRRLLREKGVRFKAVYRARVTDYSSYDGVISVGGDGTFLEAAHRIRSQWILGVNSDPARSAGSFCAANGSNFEKILDRILKRNARIQILHRLQLKLNEKPLEIPVLNDILITHRKPAAMSRYWIRVRGRREEQRSSGLWIATAAGSTGAIRSAGGQGLPRESRLLQYRPRELYQGPGHRYRLTGGVIPSNRPVQIGSLMRGGFICVDGEHWTFPFQYGDRLTLQGAPYPLRVVR